MRSKQLIQTLVLTDTSGVQIRMNFFPRPIDQKLRMKSYKQHRMERKDWLKLVTLILMFYYGDTFRFSGLYLSITGRWSKVCYRDGRLWFDFQWGYIKDYKNWYLIFIKLILKKYPCLAFSNKKDS